MTGPGDETRSVHGDPHLASGDEKQGFFDRPRNIERLYRGLLAACVLLVLIDFVYERHVVHPWEELWGFYAIYGWVGIVVLVLLAKQLRKIVMRGEDYYDAV